MNRIGCRDLLIDIETLPAISWSSDRRYEYVKSQVPKTHKKPETVAAWCEENADRIFAETSCDWR